jgi:hypothetical protein
MNHTTTEIGPSKFAPQKIGQKPENYESLLHRIISGFTRTMKSFGDDNKAVYRHKSFIEENLLNESIGHEISRTLR